MLIKVKILNGPETILEVPESEPVSSVKRMVCEKLNVPIDQQRLVFRGKALANSSSLSDHNIRSGSKLHLFTRMPDEMTKEQNFWHQLKIFLVQHFDQSDADLVLSKYRQDFKSWINGMSLDDLERVAMNHREELADR